MLREIVSRVKIYIHVLVLQVVDIIWDCLFSNLKFFLEIMGMQEARIIDY